MASDSSLKLGMVAGEVSGDLLGAGFLAEISSRQQILDARGVGGPNMLAQGFSSQFSMEKLSVMGLVEVLKNLRELMGIRSDLLSSMRAFEPDIFIGIDSPDFNLTLEAKLRAQGMKTVHYVSPSVWAWRKNRVKKIAKAVDLVLTLFPFEAEFYRDHHVPVEFVGHPLADRLVGQDARRPEVRASLGLAADAPVLAVLPGSRHSEMDALGSRFAEAVSLCLAQAGNMEVIVPAASPSLRERFQGLLRQQGIDDRVRILDGRSQEAMIAADAVLLASGTAALEAMLLARPMVVAYAFRGLTYAMLKRTDLGRMTSYSLPNVLAGETLVPELIQDEANPEALASEVMSALSRGKDWEDRMDRFKTIAVSLKRDASARAVDAVLDLIAGASAPRPS